MFFQDSVSILSIVRFSSAPCGAKIKFLANRNVLAGGHPPEGESQEAAAFFSDVQRRRQVRSRPPAAKRCLQRSPVYPRVGGYRNAPGGPASVLRHIHAAAWITGVATCSAILDGTTRRYQRRSLQVKPCFCQALAERSSTTKVGAKS